LDVVFKLLFIDPANRELLKSSLQDFLQPQAPIIHVEVLNPELQKVSPNERGAEVDLLVRLDGGRRVHVEIQIAGRAGFIGRSLYYWARTYAQHNLPRTRRLC
jgi:predicted transposase/invertase (TIGR01784 family)